MTELHDRFRMLDRIPAPDLWSDVQHRVESLADTGVGPVVGRLVWRDQTERRPVSIRWLVFVVAAVILAIAIALVASRLPRTGPLVYVSAGHVMALDVAGGPPRSIFDGGAQVVAVSADGRYASFYAASGLVVARTDGSGARTIAGPGRETPALGFGASLNAAWSPNGHELAWTQAPWLMVASPDGGDPRQIALPASTDAELDWSPDNRRLAIRVNIHCFAQGAHFYVVDTVTGDVHEVGDGIWVQDPRWSPDGSQILTAASDACGGSTRLIVIDASTNAIDVLDHQMLTAYASWSPDGSSIFYSPVGTDGGAGIWQRPLQGGEPRLLTDVDVLLLDWSPDGNRAAWLGRSADDEILGLWVMDLRDGSARRIASGLLGSLGGSWPKWSSDSSWIVFLRPPLTAPADSAEPAASMWVIRADGSGERLLLDRPDEPMNVFDVDW